MSGKTTYDPESTLLSDAALDDVFDAGDHCLRTAPIFTGDAFAAAGVEVFPQRACYGRIIGQDIEGFPLHPSSEKLYVNTNAPFSAVVCGVQGSGKSHSTAVLLESCLIRDERLGTLPEPLSALLFHYDTAAGGGAAQPCEAAYLASLDAVQGGSATPPRVVVLVLPTSLKTMRQVYASLPNVEVLPLHFAPEDINGERLLAMMKVDQEDKMPLYMECLLSILRSMDPFDYREFRKQLEAQDFDSKQKSMLQLRLSLLDMCLKGGNAQNRVSRHFRKGQLTIIDLSSPFMDASSACGFFDIILGLFTAAKLDANGKLVVLDEAHKYLSETESSSRLTESLLSLIRQQRHLATRVIISTQEPTVVPTKFLDLCSFVVAHRFSSPKWLDHLLEHVPAGDKDTRKTWLDKVIKLRTGQAMIFAPAGVGCKSGALAAFGQGYILVRSRLRVTLDGGRSLLAVEESSASRAAPNPVRAPMTPPPSRPSGSFPFTPQSAPKARLSSDGWVGVLSPRSPASSESSDDLEWFNRPPAGKGKAKMSDPPPPPPPPPAYNPSFRPPPPPVPSTSTAPQRAPAPPAKAPAPRPSAPPVNKKQSSSQIPQQYRVLVTALQQSPMERVMWSVLGTQLKGRYTGKLRAYMQGAADAGVVTLGELGTHPGMEWVKLKNGVRL